MEVFSPKFGIFGQTFSNEKIFDNLSTVKNLGFATAPPITICPLAMMPQPVNQIKSNRIKILLNRIGFVISQITHLYKEAIHSYHNLQSL